MTTTTFRPSIHGWPFENSSRYPVCFLFPRQLELEAVTLNVDFCGGMCWTALDRFYSAVPVPLNAELPLQTTLVDEIFKAQNDSLTMVTLWKMWDWQNSHDLNHYLSSGLGDRTEQEWANVKNSLDSGFPVTLTLITSSNNDNPKDLENHHRVVAYAYDVRPLSYGEGAPSGSDASVTIWIYDPNYQGQDNIALTFYLGGNKDNIRIRHNMNDAVHGFFIDDKTRDYAYSNGTKVWIKQCQQTGITSSDFAEYDLEFSWQCRVVPCFCIEVDGASWNHNDGPGQAKGSLMPCGEEQKQCQNRCGDLTCHLKIPRKLTRVTVRLLDDPEYCPSVDVDASPFIGCYPYIRSRGACDRPQVCETLTPTELYIHDEAPAASAIRQVDNDPFRWIFISGPPSIDTRPSGSDLTTGVIEVLDAYRLGNVSAPILAEFVEKNLAPPTRTTGVVKVIRQGKKVATTRIPQLNMHGQHVFSGFTRNPGDYDNDSRVEFTYESIDNYDVKANGKVTFYGMSIIYEKLTVRASVFDGSKVAKCEAAARELIEMGLIDLAIDLQVGGGAPPTVDPFVLLSRLRSDSSLQDLLSKSLETTWKDVGTWKKIWKEGLDFVKYAELRREGAGFQSTQAGVLFRATTALGEAARSSFVGLIAKGVALLVVTKLRQNPAVISKLKNL